MEALEAAECTLNGRLVAYVHALPLALRLYMHAFPHQRPLAAQANQTPRTTPLPCPFLASAPAVRAGLIRPLFVYSILRT